MKDKKDRFVMDDFKKNLLITLKFDGSHYHGWQIQKNSLTIQEVFQNSFREIYKGPFILKGCSRTDSGVHANMYCVNIKCNLAVPPERVPFLLNRYLPLDISVVSCKEVTEGFHARYSCESKEYIYKIYNSKIRDPFLRKYTYHYYYNFIDEKRLNDAAKSFIGTHDFTSFCTLDKRKILNMERTVYDFSIKKEGDLVIFRVRADGFLYNMVRIMVGTLLWVSNGRIKCSEISKILLKKDRKYAGPTAPPTGLVLNKVFYKEYP